MAAMLNVVFALAVWHDTRISGPQCFSIKIQPKIVGLYASVYSNYYHSMNLQFDFRQRPQTKVCDVED